MKTKISFLLVVFLGLTTFAIAQSVDTLGPSCNSRRHITLPIPQVPQNRSTSWCWAATAQNVMAFHGTEIKQCEVVAQVNGFDDSICCGNAITDCWGQDGFPESALSKYQFSFLNTLAPNRNLMPLTWIEATDEICQNRPFISALDLTFGDKHSVIVTGYNVKRGVRIYDPLADDIIYQSSADFFDGQSQDYERIRDTYNIKPNR